jgi:hypothetical protein
MLAALRSLSMRDCERIGSKRLDSFDAARFAMPGERVLVAVVEVAPPLFAA